MAKVLVCVCLVVFSVGCGDDDLPTDSGVGPETGIPMDGAPDSADPSDAGIAPGLLGIDDFAYEGAFRFSSDDFGDSSVNYAVGTLGYCADHGSLFIAGHAQHNMIAEFAIPDTLGTATEVGELPIVEEPLQAFEPLLGRVDNPDAIDRFTGFYWKDGDLIVNANRWYDAPGQAKATTLVVEGGDLDGTVRGYYELAGGPRAAGFMGAVPTEWQERLGGPDFTGWASNYSIVSRYSVGPTLYAFDASAVLAASPGAIEAQIHMDYAYGEGNYLAEDALEYQCSSPDETSTTCEDGARASDLWNIVSRAMYGFIVPGTRTYALFGSTGGIETGLGYKIVQDDDNLCGGPCPFGADDETNYYWFYHLDEILAAPDVSDPRPYAYGRFDVPFDDEGGHPIIGGAFAEDRGLLYLSLGSAAQVGDYDRPPLIVAFRVPTEG